MDFKDLAQAIIDARSLVAQKNKELYAARIAFVEAEKTLSERLRLSQNFDQEGEFYHVAIALDNVILDCLWGNDDRYELTVIKRI